MVRGLYTAAAGMMAKQVQMDVISQNMANAGTPGYRRDEAALRSFPQMLLNRYESLPAGRGQVAVEIGPVGTGSVVDGVYTSYREGVLQETGNPLDLALHGNAFFVVRDGQGREFYTRNGGFTLDAAGRLVTLAGLAVLGESGGQLEEIYVPAGKLEVAPEGTLRGAVTAAGQAVQRLALVEGPQPGEVWQKVGDTLFQSNAPPAMAQGYEVRQGYREGSNVNPVEEMVKMIAAMRAYEANQKVIQATDNTLEKAANEVGRV
ncbi:MAG TPA: flagellar hook-basal body protein [Syntrophomonadaceae bacterium]|nr:flagellar hook-basal body protein [Syntrophomonadaceae bacterium]